MRYYKVTLKLLLAMDIVAILVCFYVKLDASIPEQVNIVSGEETVLNLAVPASASVYGVNEDTLQEPVDLTKPFTLNQDTTRMKINLFGIIPFKDIEVHMIDSQSVVVAGFPVGIYVKTQGVMVVDLGTVQDVDQGSVSPASHILKPGDYILEMNGVEMTSRKVLINALKTLEDASVQLKVLRDREVIEVAIDCACTKDGYKLGIWIRDDMQGIGTMTYVQGREYAALGHCISDQDTGLMVKVGEGSLYQATVMNITKGVAGTPGELGGMISYGNRYHFGSVEKNTERGIYGLIDEDAVVVGEAMEVCYKQDIKEGPAYIRSWVSGEEVDYEIEITDINLGASDVTKGMEIQITDPRLLEITGGIVQGMSGTPIMQDGELVGAITHVFVNDPTRGYGVFVEEMLE